MITCLSRRFKIIWGTRYHRCAFSDVSAALSDNAQEAAFARRQDAKVLMKPPASGSNSHVKIQVEEPIQWLHHRGWPQEATSGPALRLLSHTLTFPMTVSA
jgi:hypothetical protein